MGESVKTDPQKNTGLTRQELITGITCGYSEKARYWVDPVIKFLGPIPTSTWIPIMMVIASSLFGGGGFYHCPWLLVCSNRCVHDRYCQCRSGLF